MVAFPLLLFPFFWVVSRYFLVIVPLLMIAAAKGIVQLGDRYGKKVLWLLIIVFVLFSLVGNVLANQLVDHRFEKLDPPVEQKVAGEWLKDHYPAARVMERKPWVSFYSGGTFVNFPYASYSDLVEYACMQKVDVMVVDERYTAVVRPQVAFLLEQGEKELEKIYESSSGKKLVLYRVQCS